MLDTGFLLAVVCIAIGVIGTLAQRRKADEPPGPLSFPFLGNSWRVPAKKTWMYFYSLREKYGHIVMLKELGKATLVLNNVEDVQELLFKRSGNYSSRKSLIYAQKYRSGGRRLALLPYGPQLKKQRAAVYTMMNPKVVGAYERLQEQASMKLMASIMNDPSKVYIDIKRFTAETLFMLIYGKSFDGDEDLRTVLHILQSFTQDMHPYAHLVDRFPALDWLPDVLAPWRVEARKKGEYEIKFYTRLLSDVKARMDAAGGQLECFAAGLWENVEQLGLDELSMAYVAGSAFEAGTDNTAAVILWFLVAMMHNPAVLRRAQEEIDQVLGGEGETAPCYHHFDQLPYCMALVKEVLRWHPAAPLAGPHHTLKDDDYKGFHIAAGTTVIGNIWAIHRDDHLYPNAASFDPERYLVEKKDMSPELLIEGHYAFGFGRRICPGQLFAAKSVYIAMVRLMWAFNINPPKDGNGKLILPDINAVRPGLTAEPAHFNVVFTPRSARHAQTVQQEC
ncbi:cytochrome P450 [Daedalea quercina L-15889]|uniref:Cytochrome P450 n=1 Tax=Daedalea quercina L-15889 TaxID=1314783 RepID=A0A165PM53_9APHY|nr:cytochrome P450 [Daedalea quercina L-15889]